MSEQDYIEGQRSAYEAVVRSCLKEMAGIVEADLMEVSRLVLEREQANQALRRLCEQHGIANDWPDGLHLADVIEKRLGRGLQ